MELNPSNIEFLKKRKVVPLYKNKEELVFVSLSKSSKIEEEIKTFFGKQFELIEVEEDEYFNALLYLEKGEVYRSIQEKKLNNITLCHSDSAIDLLDELLKYSSENKCSDIHIEPSNNYIRIRLRKDGSLFTYKYFELNIQNELIARVKILSSMDIAERRRAQDGRFTYSNEAYKIDIRVSSMPTTYGEKIVLRLLDPYGLEYSLYGIGMYPSQIELSKILLRQPQGLILLCGPTGSGKTSTLYTFLQILNTEEKNIITIEDPVEFNIEGINQIQVNNKAGITFESGLKTMLRQDPEVLMVGEIRNKETAEIALRASITGHLVLSTLHSNDSPSAILRLIDMGIESYMVSAGMIAVISQRLVRTLCPKCKTRVIVDDPYFSFKKQEIYKARGCSKCNSGYIGRKAVFEMFFINESIRNQIRKSIEVEEIRRRAIENGMVSLKDNLKDLILRGETSLEEAYKAIVTL